MFTSTLPRLLFLPMTIRLCLTKYSNSRPSSFAIGATLLTTPAQKDRFGDDEPDLSANRAKASLSWSWLGEDIPQTDKIRSFQCCTSKQEPHGAKQQHEGTYGVLAQTKEMPYLEDSAIFIIFVLVQVQIPAREGREGREEGVGFPWDHRGPKPNQHSYSIVIRHFAFGTDDNPTSSFLLCVNMWKHWAVSSWAQLVRKTGLKKYMNWLIVHWLREENWNKKEMCH